MKKELGLSVLCAAFVIVSALVISEVQADDVSTQVIVSNSAPAVGTVTLNGNSTITLTESTTTDVTVTATVTDANGCTDLGGVTVDLYRSGVTAAGCDTPGESDSNNCYAAVSCTQVLAGNTCTGGADTSVDYECTVTLDYYADPTDAGSTFDAQNWEATISAGDGSATSTGTDTVELATLLSLDVTASIDYGTLSAGTDTGAVNQTATVTNTGNIGLDPELSGTDMASGGDTIDVSNQEYSDAAFAYGAGTDLSGTPTELDLALPKQTTATQVTDDTLWGINIPASTPPGTYTGTNTYTATVE